MKNSWKRSRKKRLVSNTRSLADDAYAALQSDVQQPSQRSAYARPVTKRSPLGMLFLAAAVFLVLSFVLADFRVIAWALSAVLAVGGAILTRRKQQTQTKDVASQEGSPENAMEQFLKQAAVRERISAVTRELEELQDKFLELLNEPGRAGRARKDTQNRMGDLPAAERLSGPNDGNGTPAIGSRCRVGGEVRPDHQTGSRNGAI